MPERLPVAEVRVAAAARGMLLAGGPLSDERLPQVSLCAVSQLEVDFDRVLGVSPQDFGTAVLNGRSRELLRDTPRVSVAIYAAGFRRTFAALCPPTTPGGSAASATHRCDSREIPLRWTELPTAIGTVVAVANDHGLVLVRVLPDAATGVSAMIAAEFPGMRTHRADDELAHVRAVLAELAAGRPHPSELPTDVTHTPFQARVWQSLRRIPAAVTRSYQEVAVDVGSPKAVRAVGRACATNPVALVVPCHRVIRSNGELGGYRWGLPVKAELLASERRHFESPRTP